MRITPTVLATIKEKGDAIWKQVVPDRLEMADADAEDDPLEEDLMSPVPHLVHRYPDRVLFLVTDRCASYCRYCTRSRVVSGVGEQEMHLDFEQAFAAGIDAILTPATPSSAFGLGEMENADPVEMYLNDVFTVTVNLAGLPGISVPVGLDSKGLPLGLQLIGRPWEEGDLLNCAYALEQAAGFVAKPQKWW